MKPSLDLYFFLQQLTKNAVTVKLDVPLHTILKRSVMTLECCMAVGSKQFAIGSDSLVCLLAAIFVLRAII
jgi:hypothetical protein